MENLLTLLHELEIRVTAFEHQAVFNCEQANALNLAMPGAKTKNLFLKDKKGKHHFLLVIQDDKKLDLKTLATKLGVSSLSFASDKRLETYLQSEPGRVSILDILKDKSSDVTLYIDESVWHTGSIQCHPYTNEATWVIGTQDMAKLLKQQGIAYQVIPFQ